MYFNRIGVVGVGYVGLVTAACFAKLGFHVIAIDSDAEKIHALSDAKIPIYEPGLAEIIKKSLQTKAIQFSTDAREIADTSVVIMAVGTPMKEDGNADLSYLYNAIDTVVENTKTELILIVKSTVPIGTGVKLQQYINEQFPSKIVHIVSNPEFLREGLAVNDFLNPDRIIVGTSSHYSLDAMTHLYAHFINNDVPILFTDNVSAELIKYSSNAYLAMRIAFVNEIASISNVSDANLSDVVHGMGYDKRIGHHYMQAGPGFGGSCFPKDTNALIKYIESESLNLPLIANIMNSNSNRINEIIENILNIFNTYSCKVISVLGATFKANTDDMRDSPTINIINALLSNGFEVRCYDPSHTEQFKHYFDISLCKDLASCLLNSDAALVLTEWSEFRLISDADFIKHLKQKVVCDLRNILKIENSNDIRYFALGSLKCI